MSNLMGAPSRFGLENHGLTNLNMVFWTLPSPALVEIIVQRREGQLAHLGPVVVHTGHHTGRSPNDKFIVRQDSNSAQIWWGKINRALTPKQFGRLHLRMRSYFQGRDVFVQDAAVGAHPDHRLPIRIVSEYAWHSLFARNLFLRLPPAALPDHVPEFTLLDAPRFHAIPEEDGTNSEAFIVVNFERRLILIGGTSYAGEIKKAIFTVMNYLLPQRGVLPMHCAANVGPQGDVALFFGLSGTGKTALSTDPERALLGDDEHGWAEDGVFNFEGGCYAKAIRLRPEFEPVIWKATRRFGTVLENVVMDVGSRRLDFDDASVTENTRAGYPLGFVDNHVRSGRAGHPRTVFFLTADASGVLPPLARLTTEQALAQFLIGYTSKLAGTERGLDAEPQSTFSACFGAPFLPLPPSVYARLLRERLEQHRAQVWLVNTGWTGGPFGVGERIPLPITRAMIRAVLSGQLDSISTRTDPYFGLYVPLACPGVPDHYLTPHTAWVDTSAYDTRARSLAAQFRQAFEPHSLELPREVAEVGLPPG